MRVGAALVVLLLSGCASLAATPSGRSTPSLPPQRPCLVRAATTTATPRSRLAAFGAVHFVTASQGWGFGQLGPGTSGPRGVVLMTTDGGRVWTSVLQAPMSGSARPTAVDFRSARSASVAFASQARRLLTIATTHDAGSRWEWCTVATAVSPDLIQVAFANEQNGWIVVSSLALAYSRAVIYRTRDGGKTWNQEGPVHLWPLFPNGLTVTGTTLWVTGQNHSDWPDVLMVSTDAGRQWTALHVPVSGATNADTLPTVSVGGHMILPLALYLPRGMGFVLYQPGDLRGPRGFLATATVSTTVSLPDNPPFGYSVLTPQQAWVLGTHHLYRTTTGGRRWSAIYTLTAPWQAIDFVSNAIGYVAATAPGAMPVLWKSTDGGALWQRVPYVIRAGP